MDESTITMQLRGQREYNAVLAALGCLHGHLIHADAPVLVDTEILTRTLSFNTDLPISASEVRTMVERISKLIHLCKHCGHEFDGSYGFDLCPDCSKNQESKND